MTAAYKYQTENIWPVTRSCTYVSAMRWRSDSPTLKLARVRLAYQLTRDLSTAHVSLAPTVLASAELHVLSHLESTQCIDYPALPFSSHLPRLLCEEALYALVLGGTHPLKLDLIHDPVDAKPVRLAHEPKTASAHVRASPFGDRDAMTKVPVMRPRRAVDHAKIVDLLIGCDDRVAGVRFAFVCFSYTPHAPAPLYTELTAPHPLHSPPRDQRTRASERRPSPPGRHTAQTSAALPDCRGGLSGASAPTLRAQRPQRARRPRVRAR
ncbi:unnamed protein product [Cutaneotrichosporon oleaginosum]